MNNNINDGGAAFPRPASEYTQQGTCPDGNDPIKSQDGMSVRVYAAIKLKVPESGIDWLDEMIIKSKRDYFAAKAMQGIIDVYYSDDSTSLTDDGVAEHAYRIADHML